MSTVSNPTSELPRPGDRFYRTVWRWHFYAGLFVIPFLLMLAITGIIYLFKPQLDAVMDRDRLFVQPVGVTVPYTQQLQAAQRAYPDAKVNKFTPNIAPNRSAEVEITTANEQTLLVFVNPYTGKVLGDRNENRNLQAIARKIHGELMIGKVGDYLIELAACWALVLLLTGLFLWIPRQQFSVWGTLLPRLGSKNRRVLWRDLHAVPGFYALLLIGFLILTGLPWSGFWGETFAAVSSRYPAQMWDDVPKSTILTGSLNQQGVQVVPWAVEQLPMPLSYVSDTHHNHSTAPETPAASVSLDSVIATAQSKGAPPGYSVSLPKEATGVFTVSAFPDNPAQEMTLHIDRYSGKVLAAVGWQDYGFVPRVVEWGIAVHMGKYFGFGNQLLMLFACLVIIVLCVSGTAMWWMRRPTGGVGAPPLPAYVEQWKAPLAIVAVLGIVFPLVGFSLLTVLLLDYLVFSRIPALKRILN